ncbi:MAG TPA: hypothetical protein VIK95_15110 [Egibacteraceae bacterium]
MDTGAVAWAARAAGTAALWCALLVPVQTVLWDGAGAPAWMRAGGVVVALAEAVGGSLGAALGLNGYQLFGRAYLLVPVLVAVAVVLLCRGLGPSSAGWARACRGAAVTAAVVAAGGDAVSYWAGSDPDRITPLQNAGFGVELVGLLVLLLAMVGVAVDLRRRGLVPTAAVVALAANLPLAVLLGVALGGYLPHSAGLSVALGWWAAARGARRRALVAPASPAGAPTAHADA